MDEGGGAFYGPKISGAGPRRAIGRTHQMSTLQLDFQFADNVSTRPDIGPDNARHHPAS
jgi:threonyl-tRNA synthetase